MSFRVHAPVKEKKIVYAIGETAPFLKMTQVNTYSHMFGEHDVPRVNDVCRFLFERQTTPYLTGSAPKSWIDFGRKTYEDIDILAVTRGDVSSSDAFRDLAEAYQTDRMVQLGNSAFKLHTTPLMGGYMAMHTGVLEENLELTPIRKIDEIKSGLTPAPIQLCFISEDSFRVHVLGEKPGKRARKK